MVTYFRTVQIREKHEFEEDFSAVFKDIFKLKNQGAGHQLKYYYKKEKNKYAPFLWKKGNTLSVKILKYGTGTNHPKKSIKLLVTVFFLVNT